MNNRINQPTCDVEQCDRNADSEIPGVEVGGKRVAVKVCRSCLEGMDR